MKSVKFEYYEYGKKSKSKIWLHKAFNVSSFQEALEKRGKKEKILKQSKKPFNIICASDVMLFHVNFPEEFLPKMESLFFLKFSEHGYKRWVGFVAAIPSTMIAVMQPVLKTSIFSLPF